MICDKCKKEVKTTFLYSFDYGWEYYWNIFNSCDWDLLNLCKDCKKKYEEMEK